MSKQILAISGSSRPDSSNKKLLRAMSGLDLPRPIQMYDLSELPLFRSELDHHPWHRDVIHWRSMVHHSSAVIISTPAYLHNMPALLKNALEWLTTSGELSGKPVLAITLTPHHPRGDKAMQSLSWSLQALNAKVVALLPLYQNELMFTDEGKLEAGDDLDLIREAIGLLLD